MENDIEQASDTKMAIDILKKLDTEDIEQARASNMENDIEQARASNMENDIEQARASNMEEDKASTSNKGKNIHVGSASDIEMATDILKKLDTEVRKISSQQNGSESHGSECCIYRVPKPIQNVNWKAYAPLLISIGPLHRKNKRLEAMEKEKLKYFKKLIEGEGMDEKKMCDIVISIKNQEERLRNCYSEKSILMESSDDFVKMILLDAVFIIQFVLESNDDNGPKNFKPRMTLDIREDLVLLENQLPLFIIQEIYDQVSYHSSVIEPRSFLDLATCYLREYLHLQVVETSPGVEKETSPAVKKETSPGVEKETSPGVEKETSPGVEKETSPGVEKETSRDVKKETSRDVKKETSRDVKKETRHFTELLRNLVLSRAIQRTSSSDPVKLKYSAVKLRKAGVKFQVTRDKCLVNITFNKGVLKIPQLAVHHNFERLVRNIMAMEQCLYEREAYICSYIKFMDHLIDSAGDVGLLVENGIILHCLGDDATVSNMINNFCKNIDDKFTCFGDISKELNAHYENPWNHRKATLKLVYFPNIWRGTGTVAAAILLILTLLQTIDAFK